MTFDEELDRQVRNTVLKVIGEGNWLKLPHNGVEIPVSVLREAYSRVDMKTVIDQVVSKLQTLLADKIISAMSTEIGTDIKQIMCNNELREDLRAMLRERMRNAIT